MTDRDQIRVRLEEERKRLEALRADLERLGREDEQDDLAELSSADQHPADVGTETFNRERDLSLREQLDAELDEVSAAGRRLDDGTYGVCEACGRPIGEERLAAEPWARFCVEDQGMAEQERRVGRSHA